MRTVDPKQWVVRTKRTRFVFGSFTLSPLESRLRASLADAVRELWQHGPIGGQRYLHEAENKKLRNLYIFVLVGVVVVGVAVSVETERALTGRHPVTTSRLSARLHHVDFPAVAVCSNNLISRAALTGYARYLNSLDGNRTYLLQEIERHLLAFGALSEMSLATVDVRFAGFLATLGQNNITDIMFKLSPRCSAMLVRCSWRTQLVPCGQLFATRATPHGYCCAFNSRYQEEDAATPALRQSAAGRDAGLGVVVRQNSDDFAFVRRPVTGVEVMIWEGSEYPVPEGGAVASRSALLNASAYFTLSARVHRADPSLLAVGGNRRGCRMPQPGPGGARSSLAWCLLRCRVDAVRVLCACMPHLYQALYPSENIEICSLDHLLCLSKYREMLQYYNLDTSAEERVFGLRCARCRADCTRTQYLVRAEHSEYQHLHKFLKNKLSSGISFVNTTVIRVYYTRTDQELLVAETNKRWVEIFASLSCQWVVVTGATAVSALQLTYHVGLRWRHHYLRRRRLHADHKLMWSQFNKKPRRWH